MQNFAFVMHGFFRFAVRHHRLNGSVTTIEFAVEVLLLNKIWTTSMVWKHVSTGYSSTNVLEESLFLQKKRAPTQSAESGTFHCYRRAQ